MNDIHLIIFILFFLIKVAQKRNRGINVIKQPFGKNFLHFFFVFSHVFYSATFSFKVLFSPPLLRLPFSNSTAMAPSRRDLQLTFVSGGRREDAISAREDFNDLEDVRLLDSYEDEVAALGRREKDGKSMRNIQLRVTGMTCSACTSSIESAVGSVPGVARVTVSLLQNKAHVVFDPNLVKVSFLEFFLCDFFGFGREFRF